MSKQDIEKRLGFAAQGVKAEIAARPGVKEEMGIRAGNLVKFKYIVAPGDKEFRGKVVRIEGKYAIVDFGITTPAYQEWVQPGQMTRRILVDELVTAARPSAKAKMAASDIIVKKDGQYIYYYPEDDDRATFPDDNGKGAYTVKSNRTGKPVSAKTYRSIQEAAAASNEMNEKLPPLKKAKSSRPGAKAEMATPMRGGEFDQAKAILRQVASGFDLESLKEQLVSAKDVARIAPQYKALGQKMADGINMVLSAVKQMKAESMKSARPGVKAKMAAFYPIEVVNSGSVTSTMNADQFRAWAVNNVAGVSRSDSLGTIIKKFNQIAKEKGMETRVRLGNTLRNAKAKA